MRSAKQDINPIQKPEDSVSEADLQFCAQDNDDQDIPDQLQDTPPSSKHLK